VREELTVITDAGPTVGELPGPAGNDVGGQVRPQPRQKKKRKALPPKRNEVGANCAFRLECGPLSVSTARKDGSMLPTGGSKGYYHLPTYCPNCDPSGGKAPDRAYSVEDFRATKRDRTAKYRESKTARMGGQAALTASDSDGSPAASDSDR
jgi:hypothetical protein